MSEFQAPRGRTLAHDRPLHGERRTAPAQPPASLPAPETLPPLPLELAVFRDMVDPAVLAAAARRATALEVGGDEVLRCHGILPDEAIARTLAAHLDLEIDPLDDELPPRSPRLLEAACSGVLARSGPGGHTTLTVAPRGHGIRRLADALNSDPRLRLYLRMAAPERLSEHVRRIGATELAREAVLGLFSRHPELSAASRGHHWLRRPALILCMMAGAAAVVIPEQVFITIETFLGFAFLAWIGLRLHACGIRPAPPSEIDLPVRHLPIYTIIVPLYREAVIVPQLVAALQRLAYPREKLDIKLVVEADDPETRTALRKLGLGAPFEEIVAPLAGPRTKPKALATALPFARGSFVVVYDAEDEPEPDQLLVALAAFRDGPPELACVQARIAVDNVADGWLTRQFAAEYAGLFDVFLPALADLELPLPLGGTSNHFRTETLRKVGGWDPFNVTEDADLGIRLARFGFRTGVVGSTTYEEAPARLGQWLRQRTRWFKGWMQTWLVHMRAPDRLRRDLGWRGFLAFQLLVGGTVLAALVHPFFLALVLNDLATGSLLPIDASAEQTLRRGLALTTLIAGYLGSAVLGLVGLKRRGMIGTGWVLATVPLYWVLLSLAAWRAVVQLILAPYLWEKTEHGLARTSHRSGRNDAARRARPPVRAAAASQPRPRPPSVSS